MSLYQVIGTHTPDWLLADPQGGEAIAIPCTPGKGTVKRGTVMFREANGMYSPAAAADAVDGKYLVILNEDVDTNANATIAEDASAYRAGRFIEGRVTLASNAALTDAIKLTLRKQGIVFVQKDGTTTFNNEVSNQVAGG